MVELNIYSASGVLRFTTDINEKSIIRCELMRSHYIEIRFSTKNPVYFQLGDYCDTDFGRFELVDLYNPSFNKNEGSFDYVLRLDAQYYKFKNKILRYKPSDAASETSFKLTASLPIHVAMILQNIDALGTLSSSYLYNGTTRYTSAISGGVDQTVAKFINYDSMNIIDAMTSIATAFDCEWWFEGSIIKFGRCSVNGTEQVLTIGDNVESMSRSESKKIYATRIYAFGSDRNLPVNYRQATGDVVQNGVVQRRLMLPVSTPYVQSSSVQDENSAVEGVILFDGVYPRMNNRVDTVETHTQQEEGDEGETVTVTYYDITDSSGLVFLSDYILEGKELRIVFNSGSMQGMDFAVEFNPNGEDEQTAAAQVFRIIPNEDYGRSLPDTNIHPSTGDYYTLYGWDSTKVSSLGLVSAAEQELLTKAQDYLVQAEKDPSTYNVTVMSDFAYNDGYVYNLFDLGQPVRLVNPALFSGGRSSRVIGYEFCLDIPYDSPQYIVGEATSYSRIDAVQSGLDAITYNGVSYSGIGGGGGGSASVYVIALNDHTSPTSKNVYSAARADYEHLSRQRDDTAAGKIIFQKGVETGSFVQGSSGSKIDANGNAEVGTLQSRSDIKVGHYVTDGTGARIWVDGNHASYAEVDYLTVRRSAMFREITIKELKHIGGELAITPAAENCAYVEYIDANGEVTTDLSQAVKFRCYFEATDNKGNAITNDFIVSDQVRCQKFDLQNAGSGYRSTKYYWRLVTGVGTSGDYHYIDLSNVTGQYDASSGLAGVPASGDNMVQLGCRNSNYPNRQSAIILSAVSGDAPSTKYYQGIDSFSLNGLVKDEGYDSSTGVFHTNVYGESYVGKSDQTTYMKYTQSGGVEIKGVVKMTSGSELDGGTVNNTSITQVINTLTQTANSAQSDASNATQVARDAQSEAIVAKSTANSAQELAENAQDVAVSAQSSASTAQTTANNAQTTANQARTTANQADETATATANVVNNLSTGNQNLLRNSGFTGDYLPEGVSSGSEVSSQTEMYSNPFDHWTTTNATATSSIESVTGTAVVLNNGSLQQTLDSPLSAGENYIFSFKAKGSALTFTIGSYSETVSLTSTATRYTFKFVLQSASGSFSITSATCTIMELQLVQGTIPNTDWINNPNDNDRALAYFQNLTYLTNAIVNGSTSILGGLILSQQIRVGNYRNGSMVQETGGIASQSSYTFEESGGTSGIYSGEKSPFLWGGGTMEKAYYTIAKYDEDPTYEPSASELANLMAKFVVTHGGRAILNDVILRGYIVALGGIFRGNVYANGGVFNNIDSPNGNFKIDNAGNMSVKDATISGNMYAPLFVLTDANFSQYTEQIAVNNYRLLLDKTGLNIQINVNSYVALTLALPNDSKYNGAILRIYNNTWRRIMVDGVVTKCSEVEGTLHVTINDGDSRQDIEPYTYAMYQCELYNIGDVVTTRYDYRGEITKASALQKVADVSVGDRLKIVGGIVQGDDGYKVYGGTSPSSANIRFHDSTIDTSLTVKQKVEGFETDYVVASSPSCTGIYANVDYDDTTAYVCVFKMNTQAFYGWKNMDENVEDYGFPTPFTQVAFYNLRGEISQGSSPYIDENGILRFEHWIRQDRDGAIHEDG